MDGVSHKRVAAAERDFMKASDAWTAKTVSSTTTLKKSGKGFMGSTRSCWPWMIWGQSPTTEFAATLHLPPRSWQTLGLKTMRPSILQLERRLAMSATPNAADRGRHKTAQQLRQALATLQSQSNKVTISDVAKLAGVTPALVHNSYP